MLRKVIEVDTSDVRDELTTKLECISDFAYMENDVYENDGTVELEVQLEFPDEDTRGYSRSFEIETEYLTDEEIIAILNTNMDELVKEIQDDVKEKLESLISDCKKDLRSAEQLFELFCKRFGE